MRIFVALDIPEAVCAALAELRSRLEENCRGARWTPLKGAHVTLKFIGHVPPPQAERIQAALGQVRAAAPVELIFQGVGFFPNARRPRVFWAGIKGGAALGGLAAAIETELVRLGIPREAREFHPHITLARFEPSEKAGRLRDAAAAFAALEFGRATMQEFHLYQSILKSSGAEYTRLATYHFVREPQL